MEYCEGGYVNDLEYMQIHEISSEEVKTLSFSLSVFMYFRKIQNAPD